MKSKDEQLLAEAYISAVQKSINVPADSAAFAGNNDRSMEPIAPVTVVTTNEPSSDVQDTCHTVEHEESEEAWMVRSNLFSLFTNAKKLHNLSQHGMDLEPWMQQKVAVCADQLESVMKAANYEAAEKGLVC
jgi:hypothetical protein